MPEPEGPGGPLAPPILGRSINPIRTGEGRLSPPITTGPPNVFHLPASLSHINELKHLKLVNIDFFVNVLSTKDHLILDF